MGLSVLSFSTSIQLEADFETSPAKFFFGGQYLEFDQSGNTGDIDLGGDTSFARMGVEG